MEIRDAGSLRYASRLHPGGPTPPPEIRLQFLGTLQRLFKEGDFTATYKYALLQAFLDLAVESRVVDRSPLPLTTRQLAGKFVEYYWTHVESFPPEADQRKVLVQSNEAQAAVISSITRARRGIETRTPAQLERYHPERYKTLLSEVGSTVRSNPVRFIQNLNSGAVEFLFEKTRTGVTLKPDVAWCLQEFYELIQGQVRAGWIGQIRSIRKNAAILREEDDLESFLFGNSRSPLKKIRERLVELEGNKCFYCERPIQKDPQADHFIPWARYPHDLGHNFVLAHASCNHSKRDSLASGRHLERWLLRIDEKGSRIADDFRELLVCDAFRSRSVAQWAYRRDLDVAAAAERFWMAVKERKAVYLKPDRHILDFAGEWAGS